MNSFSRTSSVWCVAQTTARNLGRSKLRIYPWVKIRIKWSFFTNPGYILNSSEECIWSPNFQRESQENFWSHGQFLILLPLHENGDIMKKQKTRELILCWKQVPCGSEVSLDIPSAALISGQNDIWETEGHAELCLISSVHLHVI